MFGFGAPELIVLVCIFAPLVLWVIALVDISKSEFMGSNKILWLLVVLFFPMIGAILYLIIGKKQKVTFAFSEQNLAGSKFCGGCGQELNVRAELCPACGVMQRSLQRSGSNPAVAVVLVIVIGLGAVSVLGILAAIAIPQFSAYRMKAYDSAAIADLRNAKTSLESYAADHGGYPRSLDQAKATFSAGVQVQPARAVTP